MTTNFRNNAGTDFDSLFAPNQSGTYAADCGMRTSDGTDLSKRFEVISYGSKASDVNFRNSSGTDVTNLWAAYGTASYALACNGVHYTANSSANTSEGGTMTATLGITISNDGSWAISKSGKVVSGTPVSGTWLPSGGSVSNYQVQYSTSITWDTTLQGTITNGASSYVSCSTSRALMVTGSVAAASGKEISGTVTVTISLKNISTGAVTITTLYFTISVNGYL